ncbi:probable G- coupled receptor CG31760, partial [Paramuricea clavata]
THGKTFQDYSLWSNEIGTTNNVANYLTSMWRYKDEINRSLIENEMAIYTLAKTIAMSSDNIYGSVVCFDENKFQQRRQFCPYAFKDSKRGKRAITVHDLGRFNDYLTTPTHVLRRNNTFTKYNFNWWHADKPASNSLNISANGTSYNITSNYIPSSYGKWTTPYYDCFGGQTWMITYLAPLYDEADTYLGCVTFDIELNSIEIDQCDAPETNQTWKSTLHFYGTHACRNETTECVHEHGGGFTAANYHCVCRKGFYFPDLNAEKKYFHGSEVLAAKGKPNYKSYDCLPCRKGCEECVDDTPCMYQRNMLLRTVLLTINEIIKAVAIGLGVFVFAFRENKIIKASSPVFMEIIVFGVVLMYFEITLGYLEDSVLLCIARSWLYHTGFILSFGSLFLKTWRIAVIFRFHKNKAVKKRDTTLLKYLSLMLIAVLCYLMIWTWAQTHEYEIEKTAAGYKQFAVCPLDRPCGRGEVLLLFCGVWLCLRVRKTPSAYNESKYIAWCIYNTVFTKILVGLLRIVLDNFGNPDVSYVVDFLSTHIVATILLALLFMSKLSIQEAKDYTLNSYSK